MNIFAIPPTPNVHVHFFSYSNFIIFLSLSRYWDTRGADPHARLKTSWSFDEWSAQTFSFSHSISFKHSAQRCTISTAVVLFFLQIGLEKKMNTLLQFINHSKNIWHSISISWYKGTLFGCTFSLSAALVLSVHRAMSSTCYEDVLYLRPRHMLPPSWVTSLNNTINHPHFPMPRWLSFLIRL